MLTKEYVRDYECIPFFFPCVWFIKAYFFWEALEDPLQSQHAIEYPGKP